MKQVKFLEAVDVMIGQLIAHLSASEAAGKGRYSLCVTGDHSTPVVFGDHSHEPVPFGLAHVRHVVSAMGGQQQLGLRKPGEVIPMPDVKQPPSLEQLLQQAALQEARRQAAQAGKPFPEAAPGAGGGEVEQADVSGRSVTGSWEEAWPQVVLGDGVCSFDELSVARGGLGRFPGSQVMPLIKQFVGVEPAAAGTYAACT
jgi:hypothetical protein